MVAEPSWLDDGTATTELAVARVRELEKKLHKDRGTGIVAELEYHLRKIKGYMAAVETMLDELDRVEDSPDP